MRLKYSGKSCPAIFLAKGGFEYLQQVSQNVADLVSDLENSEDLLEKDFETIHDGGFPDFPSIISQNNLVKCVCLLSAGLPVNKKSKARRDLGKSAIGFAIYIHIYIYIYMQ